MRWSRWWFATVCYAAMSVTLFGLAWRSYAAYGRELEFFELLDPSVAYFFMGRRGIAMLALLYLMAQAVWKRMPELVLVAFALSFIGGFLEIVYFTGIQPSKIDFRPIHPAAMSQTLGWLSLACFLSGTIACLRKPRELRH